MEKIASREALVKEIAEAMQIYFESGRWFLNITTQEVDVWISRFASGLDCPWPNEGDKVIAIDPPASFESFKAMEMFADRQPEGIASKLYRALNGSRPFARFRSAVEVLDLLNDWYAFKNAWYKEKAEEWLRDEDVDFVDGQIVANGETITWINDEDEDEDEEDELL